MLTQIALRLTLNYKSFNQTIKSREYIPINVARSKAVHPFCAGSTTLAPALMRNLATAFLPWYVACMSAVQPLTQSCHKYTTWSFTLCYTVPYISLR